MKTLYKERLPTGTYRFYKQCFACGKDLVKGELSTHVTVSDGTEDKDDPMFVYHIKCFSSQEREKLLTPH